MPMIDVYATAGTFPDKHQLAVELAATLMAIEQVPDIPMFRKNTAAFVHDLPAEGLANVDGDAHYVRVQVLTNHHALDRDKQLAVVRQLTDIIAGAAGDPALTERTWVSLLTEAPDGGWGLNGHANTNEGADRRRAQRTARRLRSMHRSMVGRAPGPTRAWTSSDTRQAPRRHRMQARAAARSSDRARGRSTVGLATFHAQLKRAASRADQPSCPRACGGWACRGDCSRRFKDTRVRERSSDEHSAGREQTRRSSLSTGRGPMRRALTPRSARCSAKDSAPSGSPIRFATSLATRPISPSSCGR